MSVTVQNLKSLMIEAGIDVDVVKALDPAVPLLKQGFDSFDLPAFSAAVESRYDITISDRDVLGLRTLDDFMTFVSKHAVSAFAER
ncbi:MAG TPA: acyl carrier protein [Telmatospirillum sp.]|nr:acyl carrier protein [Telmatospirillum sp.]